MNEAPRPRGVRVLADINITPLVDVMLVLLIIFMLVTPVAQKGLDVALPQPVTPPPPPAPSHPIVMSLEGGPDGGLLVSLDQHPLAASELGSVLRTTFEALPDKTLFVRAEGVLRYGQVVGALDVARGAGVERFGILSPEAARPE